MSKHLCAFLKKDTFPDIIDYPILETIKSKFNARFLEPTRKIDQAAYSKIIRENNAEIVVTGWGSPKMTMHVYKHNPQLKYLCHIAGSVRDYVDKEAIEAGLLVTNWGDSVAKSVAEGALVMVFCCLRRIQTTVLQMNVKKGWIPKKFAQEGLFDQTIGLFGFGAVARALTNLLKPFECKISSYSPHVPEEIFKQYDVKRTNTLEELFKSNRIISIHAANSPANFHIVNAKILSLLEDGGIVVNTARGSIIRTKALYDELRSGRIYAALDVFEEEPLPSASPLRDLENCLLTPHVAGPTQDRRRLMGEVALRNLIHYLNSEPLENLITPQRYDFMT